uniref:MOK protein kinase n=1 Tax=Ailuropoda melanoleuca TaxID=9646 RepID=A0A7N5P082_AILME
MIPMRESAPTRPCSTPPSKNRETVPKARGGPSQETRTGLPHGTAQTEAFGGDQTVLLLQPRAALRVRPGGQQESASAEALQVRWRRPEDGCAEGPEGQPEAVPSAHDREEGRGVLSSPGGCLPGA